MQTTFKLFFSCLFCLLLTLVSGCGGGVPSLTPAEQAEVDKYIKEDGRNAIANYMDAARKKNETDEKRVLKYIKYLLSQGAEVSAHNDRALCIAATRGWIEVVKFLISRGANVNAKNNGEPPLQHAMHYATRMEHFEVIKFLVSKGADINAKCISGYTTLDMVSNSISVLQSALREARRNGNEAGAKIMEEQVELYTKIAKYLEGRGAKSSGR